MAENQNENKVIKEFKLTNLSVSNRTTVFILSFLILVLGVWSYITLPKEALPEVVLPQIFIGTTYPGNSPLDIENLISRPIENEINTITGVDEITSNSIQDFSTIVVKFNPDIETVKALQDVKDAVDRAKKDLPNDLLTDPNVFEINLSEFPIMSINISGGYTNDELKEYAEFLEDEIEKLPEISKVEIRGLLEREVKININNHKMASREITFGDIENAIKAENITMSGGNMLVDQFRRDIRIIGEFRDVEEIKNIIVKHENFDIVFLKDIADVSLGFAERKSYARFDGDPVVMLDVVKRSGENLINVAKKIKALIKQAEDERFPEDLNVVITNDQSRFTTDLVNNLENSIISGIILVVLILLFFLGLRNALFVGIAIPLSMFISFVVLDYMGVALNMMVFFSLILALGLLVDNGIVVVENIYRLMSEGYSPMRAAREGTGEVAMPIIFSTATTLMAFLPLAVWPGMMGEFMFYMPLGLIIVLTSSLFVALVINPVLTSIFMKVDKGENIRTKRSYVVSFVLIAVGIFFIISDVKIFGNLLTFFGLFILLNMFVLTPMARWFQKVIIPILESSYKRTLKFALRGKRPLMVLGGTILLFIFSFALLMTNMPKVIFFPEGQPGFVSIYIDKPIGTDMEETNEFTKQIENDIIELLEPYKFLVEAVVAQVGQGASNPMESLNQSVTHNKGLITVSFVEYENRQGVNTNVLLEMIRKKAKEYAGAKIIVEKSDMGPPTGKPINIEIIGEDYETLVDMANDMKNMLEEYNIPGIEELQTDLQLGKPEMIVEIDREKARRFGVSSYMIASEIRTALFGKEVSKFKQGEDEYPIQLRLDDVSRNDINTLMNQKITFRDPATGKISQVPISALATATISSTYGSVNRKDLNRVVTIYSNVREGYNANEIIKEIKKILHDYELPAEGYYFKFTGQQEEQAKEMTFLMKSLVVAVFLIFLIIVSLFNSVGTPFIITASVFFSTIGVFLGLVIFNMDFIIVMTMMGIISLAGIVVNNAIVLLDFTRLIRERRRRELDLKEGEYLPYRELVNSIVESGRIRLRPVLLTAITTILGLLPLATGMNINYTTLLSDYNPHLYFGGDSALFWGPLSWTVIFGLGTATFLTLLLVPVMYLIADRAKIRFKGMFG